MPRAGRTPTQLRPVSLERGAVRYAEGSCLAASGTRACCAASSVEDGVPGWRKGSGQGWMTAEYAMLPRATQTRTPRERKQLGGRTQEIQRLIGRSVRAMLDDFRFGEHTMRIDCDVLEADGGTRTAAITGACVAVVDAFDWMVVDGAAPGARRCGGASPAVSVGLVGGVPSLDLEYAEDVRAEVDMNVVMSSEGRFVEVQGTGEHGTFDRGQLDALLDLAGAGIAELDRRAAGRLRRVSPSAVLLATRSPGKLRELRPMFAAAGMATRDLEEAGIPAAPDEDDIECFETFEENALAKARYFRRRTGAAGGGR